MLKPRPLKPGDRVALVAPASPFPREAFERGVIALRDLGFDPVFDERVFDRQGYLAGAAETRAEVLRAAWRDPGIRGVVAVRGGYGSVQVLPLLDPDEVRAGQKVFVGSSDITSLLVFLGAECGMVCFHGPMVAGGFGRGSEGFDRDGFLQMVMRPRPAGELACPGLEVLRAGEAIGPLFGGTLTQLVASLGTPFAFRPPAGHILFLDEVGERPYRLDRMLTQLRLAGLLDRAAGLVCGELPGCDEPDGAITARAVVGDLTRDFRGPVMFGCPSGHTVGPAVTLPFGVRVRVVAKERPCLIIEEGAVEG